MRVEYLLMVKLVVVGFVLTGIDGTLGDECGI